MTKYLYGRTDNAIKNHWNSSIKKKLSELNAKYLSIKSQSNLTNCLIWDSLKSDEKTILEKLLTSGERKDYHEQYGLTNNTTKQRRQFKKLRGSNNSTETIIAKQLDTLTNNQSPQQLSLAILEELGNNDINLINSNDLCPHLVSTITDQALNTFIDQCDLKDLHSSPKIEEGSNLEKFTKYFDAQKLKDFLS